MIIDINQIEEEIKKAHKGKLHKTFSAAEHCIIETPSGRIFVKKYFPRDKTKDAAKDFEIKDSELFNSMVYSLPATRYIDVNVDLKDKVAREVRSTQKWQESGIMGPEVIYYDGEYTICFKYIKGHSLVRDLEGRLNERAFSSMLDCFHKLRDTAQKKDDLEILHSDPYADNFFYDEDRKIVIPLDSAKILNKNLTFREIDTSTSLFFLCKIFHLKTDRNTQLRYLEMATGRLSKEEREFIALFNEDPVEQRRYFDSLSLPRDNIIDIYYREEIRYSIQKSLAA